MVRTFWIFCGCSIFDYKIARGPSNCRFYQRPKILKESNMLLLGTSPCGQGLIILICMKDAQLVCHWKSCAKAYLKRLLNLSSLFLDQYFTCECYKRILYWMKKLFYSNSQLFKLSVIQTFSYSNFQLFELSVIWAFSYSNFQLFELSVIETFSYLNFQLLKPSVIWTFSYSNF